MTKDREKGGGQGGGIYFGEKHILVPTFSADSRFSP